MYGVTSDKVLRITDKEAYQRQGFDVGHEHKSPASRQTPEANTQHAATPLSTHKVTQSSDPSAMTLTGTLTVEHHFQKIFHELHSLSAGAHMVNFLIGLRMSFDKANEFDKLASRNFDGECLEAFHYMLNKNILFTWDELAQEVEITGGNRVAANKIREKFKGDLHRPLQADDQKNLITLMSPVITIWDMVLGSLNLPNEEIDKIANVE